MNSECFYKFAKRQIFLRGGKENRIAVSLAACKFFIGRPFAIAGAGKLSNMTNNSFVRFIVWSKRPVMLIAAWIAMSLLIANVAMAQCIPTTCAAERKNCGAIDNGCGGKLHCGNCNAPSTCGGDGIENVCGASGRQCIPTTCTAEGKNCGTIDNGCGGKIHCGNCNAPYTCGGSGIENICGSCTPACISTTCTAEGKNCGTIDNGCGGKIHCGNCNAPNTCGGGGTENVCGTPTARRSDLSLIAANGAAIAETDSVVAKARTKESDMFYWLGFDIATGIFGDPALGAIGNTATGPGSLRIRDGLNAAGQRGFNASVALHLSRNYRK